MATVRGVVRRITYRNEENKYTVAKIAIDDQAAFGSVAEATIVGHFPTLSVGEWVEAEGEWYVHAAFGRQFKVASHRKAPPATARGIQRYLSSGAVQGIGPKLAERLVAAFGERTLEVIEKEPHRLLEVEGIGARKKAAISKAIRAEKDVRDALVFLQGLGVTPGIAAKVYRRYGPETVRKVRENPYRLAGDVFGIGFKTADAIALEMGVAADSPVRAAAAIAHLLNQAAAEGHVYVPKALLFERLAAMGIPGEAGGRGLERLAAENEVVVESKGDGGLAEEAVYTRFLHFAEVDVAQRMAGLAASTAVRSGSEDRAPAGAEKDGRDAPHSESAGEASRAFGSAAGLTREQQRAVELAASGGPGILIITGGPGTGKTTTLRAIVDSLERAGRKYALCAPTGRAAKRLKEASGRDAKTIHRLLEYAAGSEGGPQFQRNERSPLDADVVIVDESSMVDLPLCFHLLRALRPGARLIMVGDADQLPSVGPGNVLRDALRSKAVASVRLSRVFRQAEASRIVVNAHRIQQGKMPLPGDRSSDFFFVSEEDPDKARELIADLVCRRLPDYLRCDPRQDIQVLSTVRRGPLGVDKLNELIQERLNPPAPGGAEVRVGAEAFRPGDRVMQTKNNYDKMVFNGDAGWIKSVDPKERVVEVVFPDRDEPGGVVYEEDEITQLTLAYCTSVHKSQGSEYPVVVMPVHWVMPALMNRNLLYTAVTRARRLVVLVGREDALRAYVRNDRADHRYTRLSERLRARFFELLAAGGAAPPLF